MKKKKVKSEIKIDDILLKHRRLFLYGIVDDKKMEQLTKSILVLEGLSKTKPIYLYINSPGGSVSDGFALINTIKLIKCPVYTIINGEACSMGGLISIAGTKRYITKNAFWMSHDMRGGIWGDYSGKVEYRAEFIKKCWKMIEDHLKQHTKLTNKEIEIARNGELWLSPEECLEKGIVDKLL